MSISQVTNTSGAPTSPRLTASSPVLIGQFSLPIWNVCLLIGGWRMKESVEVATAATPVVPVAREGG